ncbi:Rrf2 family transcriptional regulator [Sphingobacterium sp. N143]|uniref:RrF2 family transcriptional regulator n=1 Tax=Sphingobacterium sp. N143 TaxID=2746727 RepID=UPI002577B7DA|nr:Rrf2 family transcriptional regulator [Sphingobacterium sp. N143]MDM1294598.1 Rrf2 family transcriptional regulator [Sphingobacterium sp. N143]
MLHNLRFATALHIMVLAQLNESDQWLSSDFIASSIQVNPAIVRKEIASLKAAFLLTSKEGKGGGIRIHPENDKITLADIYLSTKQEELVGKFNNPNPNCIVGKHINSKLQDLYQEVDTDIVSRLEKIALADFSKTFN